MKQLNNLSLKFVICTILMLSGTYVHAGIFFQDNFDNQSSTWNIGLGSLPTPSGQEGTWSDEHLNVLTGSTAEAMCGTSNAATLRSLYPWAYVSGIYFNQVGSGTATVFVNPAADRNGGKAIQWTNIKGCSNGYQGGLNYDFSQNRKDIYISLWEKIESGYNKAYFSEGCKLPLRIWLSNGENIYIQYQGSDSGAFGTNNIKIYCSDGFNGGQWWDTGITPSMLYNDHNWHQLEFRIKLNSTASTADAMATAYIDGNQTGTISNTKFYTSGTVYFRNIWIEQGNCSDMPWSQTSWKSVWIDDFKLSDTYISYDGSSGGDAIPPSISNVSPTGTLAYGTTSANMTVMTDEIATCKYGTLDATYASLPTVFSTTGSTSHSQTLSGLTNGSSFTYYVRCIDGSGNANTSSAAISFSVSNSAPVVNGSCGTSSGSSFTSLTSSSPNLCATGTVSSFTGTGPWAWGCNGSGGGTSTASNACSASLLTATLLLSEDFEDTNFSARGWYDGGTCSITTAEHSNGTHAAQFSFANGASTPSSPYAGAMRRLFTASNGIYVDYYIKFPTGWQEQSGNYGHHEILVASDADDAYTSLAFAHTMAYIEHWGTSGSSTPLVPHISIQDGANIDQSQIGVDLTATTENRSVAGCNGLLDSSFFSYVNCYDAGAGTYWNGKLKSASSASMSLNAWHHVQAYFKMNTVTGGKGNADGTMVYWLDEVQQFRSDAVLFRTNQHATMKFNQFIIAPYMGNGAPRAQNFYIDNLKVYNSIPSGSSVNPVGGVSVISITNP